MAEGELDRRRQLLLRSHLRDPNGGAEPRGLDEDGVAVRVGELVADAQGDVPRHGNLGVAHHRLELVLVHRQRRAEHTGTDVRHVGQLEQTLHGAVLAEGPVQDWDHDVDIREGCGNAFGRHRERLDCRPALALAQLACGPWVERPRPAGLELPLALAVDLDRHRLVVLRVKRFEH